jgi:hypothetical protein
MKDPNLIRTKGGYVLLVDGRSVVIRRHTPSAQEREEYGLWRTIFEVEGADAWPTLKEAVAQARDLVRSEPYTLIVRTRTNPDATYLRAEVDSFDEGVRLVETLEANGDLFFELTAARVELPAAA